MTPSNLPPGCSDSDIPGNRPQDIYSDNVWGQVDDEIYEFIETNNKEMEAEELIYEAYLDEDSITHATSKVESAVEKWRKEET